METLLFIIGLVLMSLGLITLIALGHTSHINRMSEEERREYWKENPWQGKPRERR